MIVLESGNDILAHDENGAWRTKAEITVTVRCQLLSGRIAAISRCGLLIQME